MLNNLRVIRGNKLSALAEVLHRVAAIVHDIRHEPVSFVQGSPGPIDELGLDGFPAPGVAVAGRRLQLADVEPIAPIGDLAQVLQGVALATARLHLTFVLGSESLLQAGAPTPAGIHYHEDHNRGQHDNTNDDQEDDGVHGMPPHPFE
ncbi:MAG TPA: hypothetical protein VHH53_07205 [Pseudonocardiaceae bacterium]|nr:hypothetical protein [Pseudonocardiaceae bacterium]